jgi:hypothetical protein
MKQHLNIGDERSPNEVLNQALNLEGAKAAAGSPARLRVVRITAMG